MKKCLNKVFSIILVLTLMSSLMIIPASAEAFATARTPLDSHAGRSANVERAAMAVNQTRLRYGEHFSFNETVGPRTADAGFVNAPNGRGVEICGGGVAQAASTLYMALLNLDNDDLVPDDFRIYESFTGAYVDDPALAILTDYNSGADFGFTNLAYDSLVIEMWISNGYLYCSLAAGNADAWTPPAQEPAFFENTPFTAAPAPEAFFRDDSQSTSAQIDCGSDSRVLTNIEIAVHSIHDTTLEPGDIFSFNGIVGPRTTQNGYVSATNGRGAKVTGGGVAQVASVIWLAIRDRDDVAIIEKSTYGSRYNQSYVSNSADAILTDYSAGTDFAFRYTGTGHLTIYLTLTSSTLRAELKTEF